MASTSTSEFSVSFDRGARIIAAIVCLGLGAAAMATHSVIVGTLCVFVIVLAYACSPRNYSVSAQAIRVGRWIGEIQVPLVGVREIRSATPDDFRGSRKLWGNSGLFGYYGLFRTAKLGKCSWYMTNRKKAVVLVTESQTTLFSPDRVEDFIASIRSVAPVRELSGSGLRSGTVAASRSGRNIGAIVGVGIGAVSAAVGALAFLYSPGPPRLTLTHNSLAIHDRFYPVTVMANAVGIDRIRIVDISQDPDWRPTIRTNGFSNPHYHAGWFRAANGQRVRMYWADGKRLVLFPPRDDGVAVLIEVNEPEQFVTMLRQEWAGAVRSVP